MPHLLNAFLHAAPSLEGLPACFHRALVQGWLVSRAQAKIYPADQADMFLRDVILSRTRQKENALFLSKPLQDYLNTPASLKTALPFTRFMAMLFEALGPAKSGFDLSTLEGCLRFYHAFAQQLAETYRIPHALIPSGLAPLLQRAGAALKPVPGPLCSLVTEADFASSFSGTKEIAVALVGPADLENGLGSGIRYMADGLLAAGMRTEILNRYAETHVRSGDNRYRAYETTAPRAPVNIIHFNSDMLAENMLVSGIGNFTGRYNIGYFVWETSQLSKAHILGIDLVDEIWVPTEFMRELYARHTDKPVTVTGTVVNPPEAAPNRAAFGLPDDKFLFVFTYDSASRQTRKNPLGVVRAFKKAFPNEKGVGLVLKTQNAAALSDAMEIALLRELRAAIADDPRIHFIDRTLGAGDVANLLASCDAYVSLHRCEGYGYGMAEAMALGLPVIATFWSGNADFITAETGFPVPFRLVAVEKGQYHYAEEHNHLWAEPDMDEAASLMQKLFSERVVAKTRAAAGQDSMKKNSSPAAAGARMRARLETILKERP